MTTSARALAPPDRAVLDALLAGWPLGAAYARSHLRDHGLGAAGVRGYGCGPDGAAPGAPLDAAVLALDGIAWAVWRPPAPPPALAACLDPLGATLLSGPRALVEPVLAHLPAAGDGDHCPFHIARPADLRPLAPTPGPAPRPANAADLEPLIDFYIRGFYSLAQLPTRAAWRARLEEQLAHRTTMLIEEDGQVLSAAQSSAETPDAAMIGGVATLPAYRNRGLSARCVHALCTALFATGVPEIGLFYLPANLPAARLYRKLGFQPAGEWWLHRLPYG